MEQHNFTKLIRTYTGPLIITIITAIIASTFFRNGIEAMGEWWSFIRIAIVLIFVGTLIHKKWDVGLAIILASIALGVLFPLPIKKIFDVLTLGAFAPENIYLHNLAKEALVFTIIVYLINILGELLAARDGLKNLIVSLEHLVRDMRYVGAIIPAVIGLLPTPGGAMISAPFVKHISYRAKMDPETKTVCNYWFRHIWEYWWPLFPAVIYVVQNISGTSMGKIALMHLPFTLTAVLAGWFFLLRNISKPAIQKIEQKHKSEHLRIINSTMWPIIIVAASVIIAPKNISGTVFITALIIVNLILLTTKKLWNREISDVIKRSRTFSFAVLIFAVYVLRGMFDTSQAAEGLPTLLTASNIPIPVICFFVPWIVGLLTGYNLAGVSATFPFLMVFMISPDGNPLLQRVMLAYIGSFMGVMASPVHLCLVLSQQYFCADLMRAYKKMLPVYLSVCLMVFAVWFVLKII